MNKDNLLSDDDIMLCRSKTGIPTLSTHINPYDLFPINFDERINFDSNILNEAVNNEQSTNTRKRKSEAVFETA